MSAPITVVAVVGPTGAGKTALAIQLAQRFDGEIVNADSRQVYLGMDIGTAKPTIAEQEVARHHLIDIRAADEPLSLGEYLPLARQGIIAINRRGKLPVLCGGTGQYVWALLEGWQVPQVPPDPAYRAELERHAEVEGTGALWRELNALDPSRAESIGPHNTRRIIRALEILHATGEKIAAAVRSAEPPYRALVIGLTAERSVLYDRIDARFDSMMSSGLLDEVRRLAEDGYVLGSGPLASVGYSQLGAYLAGEMTLDEAIDRAKTQTHRLVRRQYTWFKLSDERVVWIDATQRLPVAEANRRVADFLSSRNKDGVIQFRTSGIALTGSRSSRMEFTKMHGAGNDYVYVDARRMPERDWGDLSRAISDRHFGVGGDGLILVMDSEVADLQMRMFNSDGSEGEMCGNGIRCFAKYAIERGIVSRSADAITIDTLAGVRTVVPHFNGSSVSAARVSMGPPRFTPAEIPVDLDPAINQQDGPIVNYAIHPGDFRLFMTFVSMGNPHAVTFIDQPVEEFPLHNIGPLVERHPIFPRRVNFEIVNLRDDGQLDARVWERGSGETMACGTGACAIGVASRLLGHTGDKVAVNLPGGTLNIEWDGEGEVFLEGPAAEVFSGVWTE